MKKIISLVAAALLLNGVAIAQNTLPDEATNPMQAASCNQGGKTLAE